MNKGTIIALGVLAVLMLLCGVGAYSFFNSATDRLEEARTEAEAAGAETLALLAGGWSFDTIELRAAAELTEDRTRQEVQEEMDEWRQRLGTLVSSEGEVTSFKVDPSGPGDPTLVAVYTADAQFDFGQATVVLTLTRNPGKTWMLADFEVSPAD